MTQTLPESPNSLTERVRKLLEKAERTDNVHEAEAFSSKAAQLVAEHRIDPAHLRTGRTRPDDLMIREISIGRGAYTRARLALLTVIADAHDVRVVFQARSTGTVAFCAGHRTDLEIAEIMYASLHQQAAAQMAGIRRKTGAATQRYRRSFLFGFAERIGVVLAESRRSVESAASARSSGDGGSVQLVLRERAERVDDFAAESWGRVRSARPAAAVGADGWRSGTEAADRADVGRTRLAGRRAIGRGNR